MLLKTSATVLERCFRPSVKLASDAALYQRVLQDFVLLPDFVSSDEHTTIVDICEKKLKRSLGRNAPYEKGHFDGVITGYRETSASSWSTKASVNDWMADFVQNRIYNLFPPTHRWLPPHILDLAAHGYISPHVDNLQASGTVVAGLCLKSPSKMILQRKDDPECSIEIFLDKQCFYAQRDFVRYEFTHAIAAPEASTWDGIPFEKTDRVSVMFRNEKEAPDASPASPPGTP